MHFDHIYISPHMDDVAYSCVGRIIDQREQGERVLVVTVFTAPPTSMALPAVTAHARRMREDKRAMALLGVEHQRLGFPDAPDRDPALSDFYNIICGDSPTDVAVRDGLISTLDHLADEHTPNRIYVPLAVGHHVDHRICRDAALRWRDDTPDDVPPLRFYEERPYATVKASVPLALHRIGASALTNLTGGEAYTRYVHSLEKAPYVRRYLGEQRDEVLAKIRTWFEGWDDEHPKTATPHTLSSREVTRASKIVGAYESQLADFWRDLHMWRRAACSDGVLNETVWRIQ